MAVLQGGRAEVPLDGRGTRIFAPGLRGEAAVADKIDLLTPTAQLFHQSIANSGITATSHILLTHQTMASEPVRLTVPAPAEGNNAVLLVHDASGAVSWHVPEMPTAAAQAFNRPSAASSATGTATATSAAAGAPQTDMSFVVSAERFAPPRGKGLLARVEGTLEGVVEHFKIHPHISGVHKVLSVLEYPIEHLIGNTGSELFKRWEYNKHPYVLRWLPAVNGLSNGEPLTPTNWKELTAGRTLLLVHGIFSSCQGGFGAIDEHTWTTLRERYRSRIIGLDHPTASEAPDVNAKWFLDQVPERVTLNLDIVCHSRGGLVARSLAKQADPARVIVHNIVFAATPNGGSEITDADRWVGLVNRITSILTLPVKLIPGPVDTLAGILAGILELVKIVGVGTALQLPGLEDMRRDSEFLQSLAEVTSTPTYYAAAAEFVPGGLLKTVFRELDDAGRVVDGAIFPNVHNDIAVPTNGVWDPANPDALDPPPAGRVVPGFPIPPQNRLPIGPGDQYWHCTYFTDPDMRTALLRWLQPET